MVGHRVMRAAAGTVALTGLVLATVSCHDSAATAPTPAFSVSSASIDRDIPIGAKHVTHVNLNGDDGYIAGAGATAGGKFYSVYLNASRASYGGVWLYYDCTLWDATTSRTEYGMGYLPGAALQGSGENRLSLRVNLATAGSAFNRATTDGGPYILSQLVIDWRKVGTDYTRQTTVFRSVSAWGGDFSEGTSRLGTALVRITAPGSPLDGWFGSGQIGATQRSVTFWTTR